MPSFVGLLTTTKVTALRALFPESTNRYVGLLTTLPADSAGGGLVEATGSGYVREALSTWSTFTMTVGVTNDMTGLQNNAAVTFPVLTGDLPGVVGYGIWDALTAGNLLAVGDLIDSARNPITRNFVAGDQPSFAAGKILIGVQSASV